MVLEILDGRSIFYALKFDFCVTKNESEYKALLIGLRLAKDWELLLWRFIVIRNWSYARFEESKRTEIGHVPYSSLGNVESVQLLCYTLYTLRAQSKSPFFSEIGQHWRSTTNRTRPR